MLRKDKNKKVWPGGLSCYSSNPDGFDKALNLITKVFDKVGLPYFIWGGLLLGWQRDGKMIDWDDDIDLGIKSQDMYKLDSVISEMKKLGYTPNPYISGTTKALAFEDKKYKLDVVDNRKRFIVTEGYYGCFFLLFNFKIDITVCYKLGNYYYWIIENVPISKYNTFRIPSIFLDELSSYNYNGKNYPIPGHTLDFLKNVYGKNWQTPAVGTPLLHRYINRRR